MKIGNCRFILNTIQKATQSSVKPKVKVGKIQQNPMAIAINNPYTAEITLNKYFSCPLFRSFLRKTIKHEAKHTEQFQIVARYFAGLKGNIDDGLQAFKKFLETKHFGNPFWFKFNKDFYKKSILKDGIITKENPLFSKAEEYVEAMKNYPDISKILDSQNKNPFKAIKTYRQQIKIYNNNILEQEAVTASKQK